jgi:hypothetical protein|tara:strand:+ start:825 stop:1424 length:600 start_codon:yes stop_codon:yes gene_type:complete
MIAGDSLEYEFITEEIKKLNLNDIVLTCEIGLRRGLGSKTIMDAVIAKGVETYRHIAIDPYGNLDYQHYDDVPSATADYTDHMKIETLYDLVKYKEFAFFEFPDTYYFETMKGGYPLSIDGKIEMHDKYSVVHLDGPHTTLAVEQQITFFMRYMEDESILILDDHKTFYKQSIDWCLKKVGFKVVREGDRKLIYKREKV